MNSSRPIKASSIQVPIDTKLRINLIKLKFKSSFFYHGNCPLVDLPHRSEHFSLHTVRSGQSLVLPEPKIAVLPRMSNVTPAT